MTPTLEKIIASKEFNRNLEDLREYDAELLARRYFLTPEEALALYQHIQQEFN